MHTKWIGVSCCNNDSVDRFNGRTNILLNELYALFSFICIASFSFKDEIKQAKWWFVWNVYEISSKHLLINIMPLKWNRNIVIFIKKIKFLSDFMIPKRGRMLIQQNKQNFFLGVFLDWDSSSNIIWTRFIACNLLIKSNTSFVFSIFFTLRLWKIDTKFLIDAIMNE